MKKSARIIAGLLSLIMMLFCLSACGGEESRNTSDSENRVLSNTLEKEESRFRKKQLAKYANISNVEVDDEIDEKQSKSENGATDSKQTKTQSNLSDPAAKTNGSTKKSAEAVSIVGTWKGAVELGDTTDEMQGTPLNDIMIGIVIEFAEDGRMIVSTEIDETDFKTALKDYIVEMLGDFTADDYEAATGQSLDDLIDEEIVGLMDELRIEEAGYYKYENGRLFTREDEDDKWEEEADFELKGDQMTMSLDEDFGSEIVLTRK